MEAAVYDRIPGTIQLAELPHLFGIFLFFVLAGSSSDYGEILLPLLAVMQDLVDSNVLSPSLVLVSFALFLLHLESSLFGFLTSHLKSGQLNSPLSRARIEFYN